jgi:hypothetical protein
VNGFLTNTILFACRLKLVDTEAIPGSLPTAVPTFVKPHQVKCAASVFLPGLLGRLYRHLSKIMSYKRRPMFIMYTPSIQMDKNNKKKNKVKKNKIKNLKK